LPACLPACLLACLPACLLACLPAYLAYPSSSPPRSLTPVTVQHAVLENALAAFNPPYIKKKGGWR
jgi:hypothetical protein